MFFGFYPIFCCNTKFAIKLISTFLVLSINYEICFGTLTLGTYSTCSDKYLFRNAIDKFHITVDGGNLVICQDYNDRLCFDSVKINDCISAIELDDNYGSCNSSSLTYTTFSDEKYHCVNLTFNKPIGKTQSQILKLHQIYLWLIISLILLLFFATFVVIIITKQSHRIKEELRFELTERLIKSV